MSAKEMLLEVAESLRPEATLDEAIRELEFRNAVREGLESIDRGERVHPVRRQVGLGCPGAHLVFKIRIGAYVVDPALLVQCGDGLGPRPLTLGGVYQPERYVTIDSTQDGRDEITAVIGLGYDPVCPVPTVRVDRGGSPSFGGVPAGDVFKQVQLVACQTDDDDPCLVRVFT
jgi:hypothetical protein